MYSRQTLTACVPTYGRVELDFEPVTEGTASSCEFACIAEPEPAAEFERALVQGVLRELAAEDSDNPEARRGSPVRARVVVRALSWHWTDSCEQVFIRLGALAVREALHCVAEGREPKAIETRVRLFF